MLLLLSTGLCWLLFDVIPPHSAVDIISPSCLLSVIAGGSGPVGWVVVNRGMGGAMADTEWGGVGCGECL